MKRRVILLAGAFVLGASILTESACVPAGDTAALSRMSERYEQLLEERTEHRWRRQASALGMLTATQFVASRNLDHTGLVLRDFLNDSELRAIAITRTDGGRARPWLALFRDAKGTPASQKDAAAVVPEAVTKGTREAASEFRVAGGREPELSGRIVLYYSAEGLRGQLEAIRREFLGKSE